LQLVGLVPGGRAAVGRTSFWRPLVDWRAKKITGDEAVDEIARRYQEFAEFFEARRTVVPA
jgi:5-dehydro-2-deoxygluconokinase